MKPVTRRTNIFLGVRHTSVFSRGIAKGIDLLVVAAVFFLGSALWPMFGLVAAALFCALQDAFGEGQSIGKRIMGLRVTDDATGQSCSYGNSAVRNLPFVLALVTGSVPWLWVLFIVVSIPAVAFECVIVLTLDSGIRLGDVLANTLVVEFEDKNVAAF